MTPPLHYNPEHLPTMTSRAANNFVDDRLFTALDSMGIAYTRRLSDRDVPYAGFRFGASPGTGDSALTAILEEDVLRVTVHDLAGPPGLAATGAGASLPVGALYVAPESGALELSLGFFVGEFAALDVLLNPLLEYADDARRFLAGHAPRPDPPWLPPVAVARGADIAAALASHGHQPARIVGGAALEVALDAQRACRVEMVEREDSWIVATARVLPPLRVAAGERERALLQRLQRWTTAGRFLLSGPGELSAEAHTPDLGAPRAPAIAWTAMQAVVMLRTALKHLEPASS